MRAMAGVLSGGVGRALSLWPGQREGADRERAGVLVAQVRVEQIVDLAFGGVADVADTGHGRRGHEPGLDRYDCRVVAGDIDVGHAPRRAFGLEETIAP